jgi:hypothetical protein
MQAFACCVPPGEKRVILGIKAHMIMLSCVCLASIFPRFPKMNYFSSALAFEIATLLSYRCIVPSTKLS